MLGAILAILSAATFAWNNAAARRGVVTGTPAQGMAITLPVGVVCFLPAAMVAHAVVRVPQLSSTDAAWMAGVGLMHFVIGRYCNYRANQAAGVNLTAPIIQLQVVVTLVQAVVILHEPCTVLQTIGAVVMLVGAFITQRQSANRVRHGASHSAICHSSRAEDVATNGPKFNPRRSSGYLFASLAALAYGITPIMARGALDHVGSAGAFLGGLIAYSSATAIIVIALLSRPLRRNVMALGCENARWFIYSGILVAVAQGLFYSAIAIAPIMLVVPMMQLSLIFRLLISAKLNPHHEVFGAPVIVGSFISIAGAFTVSVDTDLILNTFAIPETLASPLRWQI
jgi:drug/metabolite transporter (DMT)-like permease